MLISSLVFKCFTPGFQWVSCVSSYVTDVNLDYSCWFKLYFVININIVVDIAGLYYYINTHSTNATDRHYYDTYISLNRTLMITFTSYCESCERSSLCHVCNLVAHFTFRNRGCLTYRRIVPTPSMKSFSALTLNFHIISLVMPSTPQVESRSTI